jgi:hypothetical protein
MSGKTMKENFVSLPQYPQWPYHKPLLLAELFAGIKTVLLTITDFFCYGDVI